MTKITFNLLNDLVLKSWQESNSEGPFQSLNSSLGVNHTGGVRSVLKERLIHKMTFCLSIILPLLLLILEEKCFSRASAGWTKDKKMEKSIDKCKLIGGGQQKSWSHTPTLLKL